MDLSCTCDCLGLDLGVPGMTCDLTCDSSPVVQVGLPSPYGSLLPPLYLLPPPSSHAAGPSFPFTSWLLSLPRHPPPSDRLAHVQRQELTPRREVGPLSLLLHIHWPRFPSRITPCIHTKLGGGSRELSDLRLRLGTWDSSRRLANIPACDWGWSAFQVL